MLASIRAGSARTPSSIRAADPAQAANAIEISGISSHSAFQARPSRSCSHIIPSRATAAWARITRERVTRCSEISGLRLCGIVIEPTVPGVKDSRSSPISGRCSWYTSLPILPAVAEIAASSQANSATPSRAVIHGTTGTPRPSCPANASSRPRARSPQNSMLPSAPPSCTTSQRARPWPSRSRCRSSSAAQTAALNPNVIGRPGCPCVRPHIGVSRYSPASSRARSRIRVTSRAAMSPTARNTSADHVSDRSCTVAP